MVQFYNEGMTRRQIRACALEFRKAFDLEKEAYFPAVAVLELLPLRFPDFHFEVVPMRELHDLRAHAETDTAACCIRLRCDVYDGACEGKGRDRMTIAHEMGHLVMHNPSGLRLYRRFDGEVVNPCRDPEWQAKCFAGELLIPKHLVAGKSAAEVVGLCGVSLAAAEYQLEKYEKEEGKKCRESRQKKTAS